MTKRAPVVSAVLLAAGASRRMGGVNKLLLDIDGTPMVRRTAAAILASGVAELVVVLGHDREAVAGALHGLSLKSVFNAHHGDGQVTSVRAGLAAVSPVSDAVMMCLADQPLLGAEDYRRLIAAFAALPPGLIAVPTVDGERGNPVVLPAALKDEVLGRGVKFGCRNLIRDNPGLVAPVEMQNRSFLVDIDTPDDLRNHVAPARRAGTR